MTDGPAVPYHLRPKASKLAEGPDVSLEPSEAPTDAAQRMRAPFVWPRRDTSRGGTGPPDAPLAPPAMDPAARTLPPFVWPKGAGRVIVPNRSLPDTVGPEPALDPDIALWPQVIVSIWPFTGPPTEGIWPVGWLGVDHTGTIWVCVVAGEPGTWEIAGKGVLTTWGAAETAHFVGDGSPNGFVTPENVGDLYIDDRTPGLWQAIGLANTDWGLIASPTPVGGGPFAGALSLNYTLTAIQTTFLSTGALPVGVFVVIFTGAIVGAPGNPSTAAILLTEGTATATFQGPAYVNPVLPAGANTQGISIATRVTVTVSGSLEYQASYGSGSGAEILAESGYVAIPVLT